MSKIIKQIIQNRVVAGFSTRIGNDTILTKAIFGHEGNDKV